MRKFAVNIFATTGISLLLLSTVALAFNARCIYVLTVFQVFGVNVIAHFGLFIVSKLELKYASIETLLDILLIIFALIGFGKIFEWFTSTPIWVLVVLGFMMYVISIVLDLLRLKQEAQKINALIKKRNSRKAE